MATIQDYDRLRADIGANATALPDADAEDIIAEAGETYTSAAGIKAGARVIAISRLLANSAKLVDYRQDTTQESMSQVFDHLKQLLAYWRDELGTAVKLAQGASAARFGGKRTKPVRVEEWPYAPNR